MATKLDPEHAWQYETAALLSQLGCIALPPATVERIQAGLPVSEEDRRAYESHPKVAHRLLSPIPRLTEIAEMIARQRDPRAAAGTDPTSLGAAMIAVASEIDFQVARGTPVRTALDRLREDRSRRFPDRLLDALSDYSPCEAATATVKFTDLALGAVFEQDVMTKTGTRLVKKGTLLTPALHERLGRFAENGGLVEPLHVRMPRGAGTGTRPTR